MARCPSICLPLFSRMRRLLDRLGIGTHSARFSTAPRSRSTTLSLEVLEGRLCPATDIWTGAGAAPSLSHPNDNWSNPQNWQSGVAPMAGDIIQLNATAAAKVSNNDFAGGTTFSSIQFYGSDYVVQGNAIMLTMLTNGINNNGFDRDTVALPITLAAAQTFTAATDTTMILAGSLNNGGFLLTVDANGTVLFTGISISGSGGLTLEADGTYGSGKLILQDSAPDTYTGATTVTSGNLYLDGAQGSSIVGNLAAGVGPGPVQNDVVRLTLANEIADTSNVSVSPAGLLDLNGFNDTIDSLTMQGGYVTTGTGTLTLDGDVTTLATSTTAYIEGSLVLGTGSQPRTFNVAAGTAGTDLNIKATINGGAGVDLIKAGGGTMELSQENAYAGQTVVSAGTLTAASGNALGAGGVKVSSGANLEFNTTSSSTLSLAGGLTNAGVVDIEGAGTVGILAIHGNYTQAATGTLELALANTNAFDQVTVSGTAALAGTLDANGQTGFQPAVGNQFPIMTFGSSSGTFSTVDLPHANVMSLAYGPHGVTIVVTAPPKGGGNPSPTPNTDVWTGAGANDNWTNPLNWAADVAPQSGDALLFPVNSASLFSNNDFAAGTTFVSITIAGSGYQITGNDVTLQIGLTATNTSGANTVALPISLSVQNTVIGTNPGTTLTIDGVISGPYSSNLLFVGGGTVVLTAHDTFEGYATVTAGILALDNLNALSGAPIYGGRGTTVDSGATLQLWANGIYALNPLQLSGAGVGGTAGALENMAGDNIWQGPIKLDGNATITSMAGSLTTHAGITNEGYGLTANAVSSINFASIICGAGGLIKDGSGTLTLSNPAPDLYTGQTIVNAGTLMLSKSPIIESLTGAGVTVKAGATLAGSGIIDANVTNDGVVSPGGAGNVGTLVIHGRYTQAATGVLNMELESTKALDQLMISGLATLHGTLNISLLDGFQPKAGNTFRMMTFGSSSGRFRTVNLPTLSNGVVLSDVYDPLDLTIIAALIAAQN